MDLLDTVNGLFDDIKYYADGSVDTFMTAAQTANGVLQNAQSVASAFRGETLTQSQSSTVAQSFSQFYSAHARAVWIGAAIVGGVLLFKLIK